MHRNAVLGREWAHTDTSKQRRADRSLCWVCVHRH